MGTYSYDPYGGITEISHNDNYKDTDGILEKNPFRYRSYYFDTETGWYYLNSRYYDPQVKRFINSDCTQLLTNTPENLMQYNLFMYCNGDPVDSIDPFGNTTITIGYGANAVFIFGISASIEASFDFKGNIAVQRTYADAYPNETMYVGAFFAGISPIVQITCAETVDELNDISESVGGGAGLGITFSIEGVHLVDPSYPNDDFQGVQFSLPIGGVGIGFDAHLATANTETILKKNLNELFNGFVGE